MPSIKRFYVMSNGNNYAKSKNSERTETRADTLEEVLSRPGTREALSSNTLGSRQGKLIRHAND